MMKQLKIIDHTYYKVLIGVITALMLYNVYVLISIQNLIGILPILIQLGLIYLLVTKNTISQKAIMIWVIVVFFGAQVLKITGIVLQALANNIKGKNNLEILTSDKVIISIILAIVGIILWVLNQRFGEIVESS